MLIFRTNVNYANVTSSAAVQIYGDDEDWPYLSGDVDEEAVRLAASLEPDLNESGKYGLEQNSRKKWSSTQEVVGKWNSRQYCNSDGSSHCKTPDKHDGTWSLHLWKSIYFSNFLQPCYFHQLIGEILQDYLCYLVGLSDGIVLSLLQILS